MNLEIQDKIYLVMGCGQGIRKVVAKVYFRVDTSDVRIELFEIR